MANDAHRARADVLGRLLTIQQTLDALPDETRIVEFTRRALVTTVPGVSDVLIHIRDPMLSLDAKLEEICAQFEPAGYAPASLDPVARTDQSGTHYFPVRTGSRLFGLLIVRAADEVLLRPYLDFLSNIANAIGRVLDTRLYESQLSKTNKLLLELTGELRQSNRQLESEVAERKRAEAVLAQRSQELARSNAELEQLAYVASHDLQEPLRMVASYLQLLEQRYGGRLDTDAHEFIGFAVDGATRMQALIDDLLTYSRVGSRAKPLQPADCTAVVATALRALRMAIDESGAQVECETLPVVMGEAAQLTQLFQNLIANAIKFRGGQAPRIAVRAEPEGGFWRFAVQDNGIGIAPEYFDRIFVMFQRLHSRRTYPGTGIGLAICKKIVERHGGRIWVESAPEQGTTVKFTLPQETGESHE
jgi:signal transduction histidine kinase